MSSVFTISLVILPTLVYLFIIWVSTPISSIKISIAFHYLIFGGISVAIVSLTHRMLPGIFDVYSPGFFNDIYADICLYKAMIQIALLEELSKYIAFIFITKFMLDKNEHKSHPIGTMFYFGMVGLSFGLLENIQYAFLFGNQIIFARSLTSMLLHLLVGFLSGYCIAHYDINNNIKGQSRLGVFLLNHNRFKFIFYSIAAVGISTIIHGVYNFNLFMITDSSLSIMFIHLGLCFFATYIAATHLITKYQNNL